MEKITGRRNPLCVHFKKLGTDRDYRAESGEFLCDGLKLLVEADRSGAEIVAVLTCDHLPFPLPLDTKVYLTDSSIINSISPLKNAQTVLFSCKIPQKSDEVSTTGTSLLLDGLQDPGNVGTIMRTANAFSIDNIILTGACADVYNPKTIRASMGAVFRQTFRYMSPSELKQLKEKGTRFVGASLGSGSVDVTEVNLKNALIAIGSEGRGLSPDVLALCDEKVLIPISPECESLNAAIAAAILIWNAR
ncbi:MAG: RNA methyltransferase [Oscillospiraceae bacterium]|nr:RNA methyltransferase [Oscillospiraceae bacterium]